MALPVRLPQIGPRTRRVLRYVGLTFFALLTFVFALQMTFPYGRVKDKLVDALADKYEVTISGVERGFMPGRVYFKAVTLRTRPSKPEETVTTFFIKELRLDAGILSVIGGTLSLDFEAKIAVGVLSGSVSVGKFGRGDIAATVNGSNLPADSLPMRGLIGLPMSGKIQFSVDLNLPVEKSKLGKTAINWQKVRGAINLGCPTGCTFGDGKTKLKPLLKNTRNQVMVGEGIDFGKVTMDSLLAKVTIKGGKLKLDKFETHSKDGELKVDFELALEKSFDESQVTGCLRFKGTDDLLKREPKTFAAIQTTGAELRADGLFHIRLTDRFKDMKRLNQECGPNVASPGGDKDKHERPGLNVTNDSPKTPPTPALTPPVPTPETPAAETAPTPPSDTAAEREMREREAKEKVEAPKPEGEGSAAGSAAPPPTEGSAGSAQQPSIE